VKANKLYEGDFKVICERFKHIRSSIEADAFRRKTEALLSHPRDEAIRMIENIDEELRLRLSDLDEHVAFVTQANNPTEKGRVDLNQLFDISKHTYTDLDGTVRPYLTDDEVVNLSVGRGSLNAQERLEIESHVTHTFNFLRQIPWTRELRRVPTIAYAHHEKLNGGGYPNQLNSDEIPLQSKIMTVCDIYDALTAADRPYKKSLTAEAAIDILRSDCQRGLIDPDLLQLFIEGRVYEQALRQGLTPVRI